MAETPRLRVFAGPNGSGKSTILEEVRRTRIDGRPIDFGVYVNADDIARTLRTLGRFDFSAYRVDATQETFDAFAERSGLLGEAFSPSAYRRGRKVLAGAFELKTKKYVDRYAQLIAQYLYDRLLASRRKLSFETVLSHESKLKLMKRARDAGYKVYLYFVATADVAINIERVSIRVKQGGHHVAEDAIVRRYRRTLSLLREAIDAADTAYCWDNSGAEATLFCESKRTSQGRSWTWLAKRPSWFDELYGALERTLK